MENIICRLKINNKVIKLQSDKVLRPLLDKQIRIKEHRIVTRKQFPRKLAEHLHDG
jgi:hypothetical protein